MNKFRRNFRAQQPTNKFQRNLLALGLNHTQTVNIFSSEAGPFEQCAPCPLQSSRCPRGHFSCGTNRKVPGRRQCPLLYPALLVPDPERKQPNQNGHQAAQEEPADHQDQVGQLQAAVRVGCQTALSQGVMVFSTQKK